LILLWREPETWRVTLFLVCWFGMGIECASVWQMIGLLKGWYSDLLWKSSWLSFKPNDFVKAFPSCGFDELAHRWLMRFFISSHQAYKRGVSRAATMRFGDKPAFCGFWGMRFGDKPALSVPCRF
jgi:hypothetical protein